MKCNPLYQHCLQSPTHSKCPRVRSSSAWSARHLSHFWERVPPDRLLVSIGYAWHRDCDVAGMSKIYAVFLGGFAVFSVACGGVEPRNTKSSVSRSAPEATTEAPLPIPSVGPVSIVHVCGVWMLQAAGRAVVVGSEPSQVFEPGAHTINLAFGIKCGFTVNDDGLPHE